MLVIIDHTGAFLRRHALPPSLIVKLNFKRADHLVLADLSAGQGHTEFVTLMAVQKRSKLGVNVRENAELYFLTHSVLFAEGNFHW